MFDSIDQVLAKLTEQDYIGDKKIGTVVFLADRLEKPVLVEGPAGVGKTELAKVVAKATGRKLIRLQCYEGLDEAKALYEWEYSKQLLYTQILKEKFTEAMAGAATLRDAAERVGKEDSVFFSDHFIVPRPLLTAITSDEPVLLLIDEVDKSDPEFEAFLLEVLADFQVTVPELGTVEATIKPLVFLTSNNAREMSDALKRRCLHLYIDFPNEELEKRILETKVPGVGRGAGRRSRGHDAPAAPARPEEDAVDQRDARLGARAARAERERARRGARQPDLQRDPQYEGDVRKAQAELDKLLQNKAGEARAAKPVAAPEPAPAATKKGALH